MLGCYFKGGGVARQLDLKSTPPVLLPLPGNTFKPAVVNDFCAQTFDNRPQRRLKSPPMGFGTHGVNSAASGTSVTFKPQWLEAPGKIPARITVSPEFPVATRTGGWPRPRIILACLN